MTKTEAPIMQDTPSDTTPPYETLGWPRMLVALVTLAVVGWYMIWRLGTINPEARAFSWMLYIAEGFGILSMLLHFFMVRRLSVREAPLPKPGYSVDVFIPTVNEPIDILRRTVVKALDMSYPHQTYVLDDGNREDVRLLAKHLGCQYLARGTRQDAKAGNLNYGLQHSTGEFIAMFDADHAPKQTFLLRTLGYFSDPKVAFVQTPQDFYNLDSYQHSLERKKGRVWTEQSLFFRIIMRGKDYWNAAFFCGSCTIIRRSALDAIGGIATGTVTEDLHTSIRLHKYGFSSVYHAESLAFGIAPAQLEPYLKQRIRWGQGAMQVWRKEGVLFTRGLTLAQRLNYFASMSTYFDGWQKFLYYTTPAVVLMTGWMPLVTNTQDFLIHFIPYFVMMSWCFEELGRGYGEMLIVEQYNMARFAALCWSTFGVFMGKLKFRVTSKRLTSTLANRWYLLPQYAMFLLNVIAIPVGILLYMYYRHITTFSLEANLSWALVNTLLAAMVLLFTLRRANYRRHNYRFAIPLVARLRTPLGREAFVAVQDLSCSGALMLAPRDLKPLRGDVYTGELYLPKGAVPFQIIARAVYDKREPRTLSCIGCEFIWSDAASRQQVEQFLYGSDLEWQIHNLSEVNWTPLGWIYRKKAAGRARQKTPDSALSAMMLKPRGTAVNTGFISVDRDAGRATAMIFHPLPVGGAFETEMFTRDGWRPMQARIARQKFNPTEWPNMYLYELEGVSA